MQQTLHNQAENQQSLFNRAKEMAKGKDEKQLEQIAKNICELKGIEYGSAMEQFMKMWYGK